MNIFSWDGEGPWGSPRKPRKSAPLGNGTPQQNFDIDDLVVLMRERLGGQFGNGDGGFPFGGLKFIGLAVVGIWLLSGFYIVAQDQQGVAMRFGKYTQTTEPGLHWNWPAPVGQVIKPAVTRENVVEIGFRTPQNSSFFADDVSANSSIDVDAESLMLTGDENIVDLDFTVRWRIADARAFLFNVWDVPATIKNVAESVMREVIGRHPIDDALTGNKSVIQQQAKEHMQAILDSYKAGITINGVELQQVNPPAEVLDAFRDVQAARSDAEKATNEAEGYANDILPRARGQAAQVLQEAEGYKTATIARANGDAQRFLAQLDEYRSAPEVTRTRLYMETMQKVVGEANKIILPDGGSKNILPFLPLKDTSMGGVK
ncbi:MAG: FtsH protease activity modulator HflK [Alphaproteobacteria bacterium]